MTYIKPPPVQLLIEDNIHEEPESMELNREQLEALVHNIRDEVVVVISDVHFPYHDEEAMDLFFAWLEENEVDRVFLNGDILDMYSLSKFAKNPANKKAAIQEEVKACKEFLEQLREKTDAPAYFIMGNHCQRLQTYIKTKAPELYGTLGIPELLDFEKYNINWIPGGKEAFLQYGKTLIGHFNKVSKHSCYTVKALAEDYPGFNICQSHTHRQGLFFKSTGGKTIWAAEQGCMADPKQADYVAIPNWQRGYCVITTDSEGEQIAELAQIRNGKLHFRGEVYFMKD